MTDAEKQERQKTVVAFIAGLLIGGLLVWIFSSSSSTSEEAAEQAAVNSAGDDQAMMDDTKEDTMTGHNDTGMTSSDMDTSMDSVISSGDGSISVGSQPAGMEVKLARVTYPTTDGWIVVRDYADGVAGGILGAARYSTTVGLLPESVELLRATEAGSKYQVTFYTENGDLVFDTMTDMPMTGAEVYFFAE